MASEAPDYVFLDTNIFYNDWFLNNANLRYLFHYISNESCTLLISDLVCEEVENIRRRELIELTKDFERQLKQFHKLNNSSPCIDLSSLDKPYNFKTLLQEKCENVYFLSYRDVPHDLLVRKALGLRKPFLDGEKGYRDALIWLSLVKYLGDAEIIRKVAYVTNNKTDFFSTGKDGVVLHSDLIGDLRENGVKAEIIPYTSLFKFVDAVIDKKQHALNNAKTTYEAEEYLEYESVEFLENSPLIRVRDSLIRAGLHSALVNEILSIDVNLMEGIEDIDLVTHDVVDKNNIFIYFAYDLRILYLAFKFSAAAYYANKDIMESELMNFEIDDSFVTAGIPMRAYFDASCIFDPLDESFSSFTVAALKFRI